MYVGVLVVLERWVCGLPWYVGVIPYISLSSIASLLFLSHWGRVNTQVSEGEDKGLMHTRLFLGWCVGGILPFILMPLAVASEIEGILVGVAALCAAAPFVWAYGHSHSLSNEVQHDQQSPVSVPESIEVIPSESSIPAPKVALCKSISPGDVICVVSVVAAQELPPGVIQLPEAGTARHQELLAKRSGAKRRVTPRRKGPAPSYLRLLFTGTSR